MNFHEWVTALAGFVLVTAGTFVVLSLITSYVRFERMARQLEADHQAMDPHDAFQLAISKALGTAHRMPDPFCVFVMRPLATPEAMEALAAMLRKSVRADDGVFVLTDHRVGLLIHAARRHVETIFHRISQTRAAGVAAHPLWLAGVSTCPENGDRVLDLLSAAEEALKQAEKERSGDLILAPPAIPPASPSLAESTAARASRYVDPLTGLLRPEHVGPAVQKYMAALRRQELPVSLLLIDVDHLERYNAHYGREAGDVILKTVGSLIEKGFRETDLTARLAGEEFLVAIACCPAEALSAAQRLVATVKRTPIPFGCETLRVTIKVGVAGFPDHGSHPRSLLEKADMALADARERGGNTSVLYTFSIQPPRRHASAEHF